MYKVYFKQAVALLKQNKFISAISVVGTALAIMMMMVIVVVDHIENADIAPESNRSKLMYVQQMSAVKTNENWMNNSAISKEVVTDLLRDLKSPKLISITQSWLSTPVKIATPNNKLGIFADCRPTDAAYWQLFNFNFVEGRPLNEAELESGVHHVVIVESIAQQLYGKESAIGKEIDINRVKFTIVGVVEDVAQLFQHAYSQIWVSSLTLNYDTNNNNMLIMLVDEDKIEDLSKELRAYEKKWDLANDGWNLSLRGPYSHRHLKNSAHSDEYELMLNKNARNRIVILMLIIFIIPAINLSSLSVSRVQRRMEEIGIRKAFGAKKSTILIQVLYENFITSLLGGAIGMLLSIGIVYVLKAWLLKSVNEGSIPISAFISFTLLIAVVLISFILNLLSSAIPAYRAARMNIVNSLNKK